MSHDTPPNLSPSSPGAEESFAKPKTPKTIPELVRDRMPQVYKDLRDNSGETGRHKNRAGPGFPKRFERLMTGELRPLESSGYGNSETARVERLRQYWRPPTPRMNAAKQPGITAEPILTELIEVLLEYCLAHLKHVLEKEEPPHAVNGSSRHVQRKQSKLCSPGADETSAPSAPSDFAAATRGAPQLKISITEANRAAEEEAFQDMQAKCLQDCAQFYSQLLLVNSDWNCNSQEDKNFFELIYSFINKVILACVKDRMESGEVRPKTGTQSTSRPLNVVEDELERLYRSSVFNTRARKRERRQSVNGEDTQRFSLDDGGKNKGIDKDDDQKTKGTSIDAIITRFLQNATCRRTRSSKSKGGMQYASTSRSPMISSVLPSSRQKLFEMDTIRTHNMGISMASPSRLAQDLRSPVSSAAASPRKPKGAVMVVQEQELEQQFTNRWALTRRRVKHNYGFKSIVTRDELLPEQTPRGEYVRSQMMQALEQEGAQLDRQVDPDVAAGFQEMLTSNPKAAQMETMRQLFPREFEEAVGVH